ncbi:dipeptidase PepV, partial [Staphylococcus aureus]
FHTDVMGDVTTNIGVITYDNENAGLFGINLRYTEGFEFEQAMDRFASELQQYGFEEKFGQAQPPQYVGKNDPFEQKLVPA